MMKSILAAAMAAGVALAAQTQEGGAPATVRDLAAQLQEARPEVGRRCVEELAHRGEEGVRQLVAMLRESNDADTVRASFALEALTMHLSRPARRTRAACSRRRSPRCSTVAAPTMCRVRCW